MVKLIKSKTKEILTLMKKGYFRIRNTHLPLKNSIKVFSKLNLGSGETYLEGYLNIDLDPNRKIDLLMNFTEVPEILTDDSIEEVLMIHSLSYLTEWDAKKLLSELRIKLRNEGRLIIEFPDSFKCSNLLLKTSKNLDAIEYMEAVRGFYAFGIEDYYNKNDYHPYKFGWCEEYLIYILLELGYTKAWGEEPQTHGARTWRDSRVIALK